MGWLGPSGKGEGNREGMVLAFISNVCSYQELHEGLSTSEGGKMHGVEKDLEIVMFWGLPTNMP